MFYYLHQMCIYHKGYTFPMFRAMFYMKILYKGLGTKYNLLR